MNRKLIAIAGALVFGAAVAPSASSASPEFLTYEGRNAVHEGQGGNRKTVEGIDFWFNGDPPGRYEVIGQISDRRMRTGLYGLIRMSGLESDIAKTAKAAGGDAVILQREGEDLLGVSGFGNAYVTGGRGYASGFGSSYSAPVEAHVSSYVVVKYLPETPGGPSPEAPPVPQNPDANSAAPVIQ